MELLQQKPGKHSSVCVYQWRLDLLFLVMNDCVLSALALRWVSRICFAVLHHIRVDYIMVLCVWLTLSGRFCSLDMIRLHLCNSIV